MLCIASLALLLFSLGILLGGFLTTISLTRSSWDRVQNGTNVSDFFNDLKSCLDLVTNWNNSTTTTNNDAANCSPALLQNISGDPSSLLDNFENLQACVHSAENKTACLRRNAAHAWNLFKDMKSCLNFDMDKNPCLENWQIDGDWSRAATILLAASVLCCVAAMIMSTLACFACCFRSCLTPGLPSFACLAFLFNSVGVLIYALKSNKKISVHDIPRGWDALMSKDSNEFSIFIGVSASLVHLMNTVVGGVLMKFAQKLD